MSHTDFSPADDESEFAFDEVSDVQLSTRERTWRILDEFVIAPFRVLWSDYRARIGLLIVGFYVLVGTVGVMVVPEPAYHGTEKFLPWFQTMGYPLGSDNQGRGLFRQLVHATRPMLLMILSGAVFSTGVATIIGTVSGYKGGLLDRTTMSIVDIVMTIPSLPLVIILAATIQPENPIIIGLVLSITSWAGLSRNVRSQVLSLREENYIESSRTMGISTGTIVTKDVAPNIMPYVMVHFVNSGRGIIFSSVALYFLGFLPFQPGGTKNWGIMLNTAYGSGALAIPSYYYWFAAPMFAIVTFSYGLIMLGQGTDRIFNPRIRARHAKTVDDDGANITETSQ